MNGQATKPDAGRAGFGRRTSPRRRADRRVGIERFGRTPERLRITLAPDAADLFRAGRQTIESLPFADPVMRSEMAPRLPRLCAVADTADGPAVDLACPAELVGLADLVAHCGGRLPAAHVGWVLSSLYNIACYLDWAGLVHGAISAEACLVDPARHDLALLGGWWYAAPLAAPLAALPVHGLARLAAAGQLRRPVADPAQDLDAIRALGRTLLGCPHGPMVPDHDGTVPPALAAWLNGRSAGDPIDDYAGWRAVLRAAFGPPRFVPLPVHARDLYGPW